jgi:hypothetical protein
VTLAHSPASRRFIIVGAPALAVLTGFLLPPLARWLLGVTGGLPFRLVFRIAGSVDKPWEVAVNLAIWFLAGLAFACSETIGSAEVTLSGAMVRLTRGPRVVTIAREEIGAVFLDGHDLVVLDHQSRQLARERHQAPGAVIGQAFRRYGYPWRDCSP